MLSSSCLTPHILFLVEEWNWNVTNQRRSDGWKEQACRCDQTSWLELSKCQVTFPYDAIVLLQPPMSFKRAHTEKLLGGNEPLKSFWPCPMFSVSPMGFFLTCILMAKQTFVLHCRNVSHFLLHSDHLHIGKMAWTKLLLLPTQSDYKRTSGQWMVSIGRNIWNTVPKSCCS